MQAGDVDEVCRLVGRASVPDGLARYREALDAGLSEEAQIIGGGGGTSGSVAMRFAVGGGDDVLGLSFQQQSGGWVLVLAAFLPA